MVSLYSDTNTSKKNKQDDYGLFTSIAAGLGSGVFKIFEGAATLAATLSDLDVQPIGPKVAPIEKVSGYYRHNVFYKVGNDDLDLFKARLGAFPKKRDVRLVVDIDPMSLL